MPAGYELYGGSVLIPVVVICTSTNGVALVVSIFRRLRKRNAPFLLASFLAVLGWIGAWEFHVLRASGIPTGAVVKHLVSAAAPSNNRWNGRDA